MPLPNLLMSNDAGHNSPLSRIAGASNATLGCGKTHPVVILRSPDLFGATKDHRSSLKLQLLGFFASLRMTWCKGYSAARADRLLCGRVRTAKRPPVTGWQGNCTRFKDLVAIFLTLCRSELHPSETFKQNLTTFDGG